MNASGSGGDALALDDRRDCGYDCDYDYDDARVDAIGQSDLSSVSSVRRVNLIRPMRRLGRCQSPYRFGVVFSFRVRVRVRDHYDDRDDVSERGDPNSHSRYSATWTGTTSPSSSSSCPFSNSPSLSPPSHPYPHSHIYFYFYF